MPRVQKLTAKEVLDEVDRYRPFDEEDNIERLFELMYQFIQGLHPATCTLPRPLKKK